MSLPRYPAYKDSSVSWLGEVPAHWEMKPLWTLYRRSKRINFPNEELLSVYRDFGVIPKSSRDDNNNRPSEDLSLYQLVNPNDLVINKMKAWQGSVAISEYRGIVSPAYFVYESLHNGDSRYFHYLMRSMEYTAGYLSISKGIRVSQWDLEPQYHSRMPVLIPSSDERKQIAKVLDHETAKIDALIVEQEKLIALLAEKRQATISRAVTRGLDPNVPLKDSGVPWLGKVPAHWDISRVKFYCEVKGRIGFRGYTTDDQVGEGEGALVLGATQIDRMGNISLDEPVYISWKKYYESPEIMIDQGDVLLVQRGSTCGKVGMIGSDYGPATINPSIVVLKRFSAMPEFVFFFLSSELIQSYIGSFLAKTAIPMLSQEQIGNIFLCVPNFEEQKSIVQFLKNETSRLDVQIAEAGRAINLLKERRAALISAAVTGKIDVRGLAA